MQYLTTSVTTCILKARDIIEHPDRYQTVDPAQDEHGNAVPPYSPEARSWSLWGAVHATGCPPKDRDEAFFLLDFCHHDSSLPMHAKFDGLSHEEAIDLLDEALIAQMMENADAAVRKSRALGDHSSRRAAEISYIAERGQARRRGVTVEGEPGQDCWSLLHKEES